MRNAWIVAMGYAAVLGVMAAASGCRKKDEPAPQPTPDPPACQPMDMAITDPPAVYFCMDGDEVYVTLSPDIIQAMDVAEDPGPPVRIGYGSLFFDIGTLAPRFETRLGHFTPSGPVPTPAEFIGYFEPGPRTAGDPSIEPGRVRLSWWDAAGAEWSSLCPGGAAPDLNFSITHRTEELVAGEWVVTIRATFSGTFQNCAGSATASVSHGVVVTTFRPS